jgi:hypothetical protein
VLAGILLAYLGFYLYSQEKELDIAYAKKQKIQELSTILLNHINISVKDYQTQISAFEGNSIVVKTLLDYINSISPGHVDVQNTSRFSKYINDIADSLNLLSTHLALGDKHKQNLGVLQDNVPTLNTYFSTVSVLSKMSKADLQEISKVITEKSTLIKGTLQCIISK